METHELAGLIRAFDCYVSPHRVESFGLTVAEAMALGVPVIATDYGGTVDFVTEEADFPFAIVWWKSTRTTVPMQRGRYGRIRHARFCGNCCAAWSRIRAKRRQGGSGSARAC